MRASSLLRTILSLQGLFVSEVSFDDLGVVADVSLRKRVPCCGDCGTRVRRVHDRRTRTWRHLDVAGMQVRLRYAIRRVRCHRCRGVKTESVPWASPGAGFTTSFEERVAYLAQQCSKTTVSRLMRVAWRTVGDIIHRVVERHFSDADDRLDGLRHIGIDELSYRRHHEYVTVVIDHVSGRVVWSKPGKNAATLHEFFDELGEERCAAIESITIDMSGAYISAVRDRAPKARLVFDRFHVQRLVHEALDETRRDEVRDAAPSDKKALKGSRWALQKNPWLLSSTEIQTLDQLQWQNWTLYRAYLLKESFAGILDGRQINVARSKLIQWVEDAKASGLTHFAKVARTVTKHMDGILEYVRTRFSNGRTEGMNGKIRTITRRAFGFHSAQALISMIFLCCGGVEVTPAFSSPGSFH